MRWIEFFSFIEAGIVVTTDYIVDAVMEAENRKVALQVRRRLAYFPTS